MISQDDCRTIGLAFLKGKNITEIAAEMMISRRQIEGILRAQWRAIIDSATVRDATGQLVTADKLRTVASLLPHETTEFQMVRLVLFEAANRLEPLDRLLTAEPETPQTEPSHAH